MVLDLVEFQHLPYFTVDKGCVIVTNNPVGYPKPHNYVFFDEVCYCPPVALRSGTTSTHFVKYSIATRIHMYPRDGGLTGPTKSSPQVLKGHGVTMLCKFCG